MAKRKTRVTRKAKPRRKARRRSSAAERRLQADPMLREEPGQFGWAVVVVLAVAVVAALFYGLTQDTQTVATSPETLNPPVTTGQSEPSPAGARASGEVAPYAPAGATEVPRGGSQQ